ncbi:glycoside hydrolase [Dipodascopsis tothii]|uniref:glycoside hydrolase n=1 Tax=Dipodascopsis tothii TaxID=44089 RepID=UPI0034CDB732
MRSAGLGWLGPLGLALLTLGRAVAAIEIDTSSQDSIKHASWVFAHGLMSYYNGNQTGQTVGMFVDGYYWWESGAAWGSMLDYWYYTGDETYNDIITAALLHQAGSDKNYMPSNQTTTEGNDDQAFWGFTVMAAAERNFTNPPDDDAQWLELSQGVFNSMAARWDTQYCGGGLRWQIFQFNNGYDYKNTVSNAGLFMMAARLARYTSNDTYYDWAVRVWDWVADVGFMNPDYYYFYDGAYISTNCTTINNLQWTYNAGLFLASSAYLYNYTATLGNTTDATMWANRTQNILDNIGIFFKSGIMYEVACETGDKCNTDERSFKAYLARFMGLTAQLAPFTYDTIYNYLLTTSPGIASSCTGGSDNVTCGATWITGEWDSTWGLGQQMCALEATQNLLVGSVAAPYTSTTGGSSKGDASAGTSGDDDEEDSNKTTVGDRVGAGFLTSIVLFILLGAAWWIVV